MLTFLSLPRHQVSAALCDHFISDRGGGSDIIIEPARDEGEDKRKVRK